MRLQRTLKRSVEIRGVGLHSGREVTLRLHPASENHGIVFHRVDLGSVYIPAHVRFVSSERSTLSTVLFDGQATVQTIEHLISALNGLYLDNLVAEVDGVELPILDGSSNNVLQAILEAGIVEQKKSQKFYHVTRMQEFESGSKYLKAEPSDRFEVDYEIDFGPSLVQRFKFVLGEESYGEEIAKAKTFCFESDILKMRSMGLAKGGTLSNALVMGKTSLLNPDQQTYPDEFVRHKILDFLGDMRLLDRPIVGKFTVRRGGHAFHTECLRTLWKDAILAVSEEKEAEALSPVAGRVGDVRAMSTLRSA